MEDARPSGSHSLSQVHVKLATLINDLNETFDSEIEEVSGDELDSLIESNEGDDNGDGESYDAVESDDHEQDDE